MMSMSSRPAHLGLALGSLAVLTGCQAGDVALTVGDDPVDQATGPSSSDTTVEAAPSESAPEPVTTLPALTDGSYEATGGYQSPNGPETILVSVEVSGGVVTQVTVTPQASSSTSSRYQGMFAGGIAEEIIGQPIDGLQVSRVAGSSLTGGGFNDALNQMRQGSTPEQSTDTYFPY
jgi:membrane-associated protease RseP (regulator of RpoE activity)